MSYYRGLCLKMGMGLGMLLLPGAASAQCSPADPQAVETRTAALSGACADNQDNDCDGYTDLDDDSCKIETRWPANSAVCGDGYDNDADGYIDGQGGTAVPNPLITQDPECRGEVYCYDGFDNDADGVTDTADMDCRCMDTVEGNSQNCTSNDFSVAFTANPQDIVDGCINSSDYAGVRGLLATVAGAQPDRPDLALWIAIEGTTSSAKTGPRCLRQIFTPVTYATPPASGTVVQAPGPYPVLEPASPQDQRDVCGDLGSTIGAVYEFPMEVPVPCADALPNGFVDLGQCGSWNNNDQNICSAVTEARPQTKAKCQCATNETGLPGPNFRMVCTNFTPTGVGPTLDVNETATYTLAFTNTVANCTSGSPTGGDPFGRTRCGTASFVRMAIEYGTADTRGDFYYNNGAGNIAVPACTSTAIVAANNGVLCNDTTNSRLIWAPRDPNTSNTYGVISAFAGTQTLPFRYTLTDGSSTAGISFTARIYWDGALDTNLDNSVSTVEAVTLTSASRLQTCSDCTCTAASLTTPITLSAFEATPEGRGTMRFAWTTETEVGNVGFNLYANVGKERVRLNAEPVAAESTDSLAPQSYSMTVAVPAGTESFEIEDFDLRGKVTAHGPFLAGKAYGTVIENEAVDWSAVRRDHGLRSGGDSLALQPISGAARSSRTPSVAHSAAPVGTTLDLLVDRDGLYRVTFEQILAAGFDLRNELSGRLGLSVGGTPVPIFVGGGNKFGPGSFIEFWGEAVDTIYTRSNVYRLATGQNRAARATISTAAPQGAAATSYVESRRFERDRTYSFWSPAADPFADTEMLVFGTAAQWPFPFSIDGYHASGGPATVSAEVYGATSFPNVAPDHVVEFDVNGVAVGEVSFDGTAAGNFSAELPAGSLAEGANTLTLRLPALAGVPYNLTSLDGFTVTYPRAFAAQSGALSFRGASGRFEVTGLPDANVVAYRKDASGTLTRLASVAVAAGSGGGFTAVLPGAPGEADYAVASASALLPARAIRASRLAADLRTGPASYLILAHSSFVDGIQPLAAAHAAEGMTVKVVDVQDVYAGFRSGVVDAEAIREYIAFAAQSMGTRYVLLVGGDTFDYLDDLGFGAVSFVPSLYRETGPIIRWAPSDSAYADIDHDGLQDLAIGRLPVRTARELSDVVTKTLQYAAKGYASKGLFAADYTDPKANEPYRYASDRLVGNLPALWEVERVNLDEKPLADARAALFGGLADGAALTSYVGHSGIASWGSGMRPMSQHLLTVGDIASLGNAGSPTVVSQLGCWNNYYVSPSTESLGAKLMLAGEQGAAAVLGSVALTEDINGNRFGLALTRRLALSGKRLGDAVAEAKRAFSEESQPDSDLRDVLLGWTLLGDPALQVAP